MENATYFDGYKRRQAEKNVFIPVVTPSMNRLLHSWKTYHYSYKRPWGRTISLFFQSRKAEKIRRYILIVTYHNRFYDKDNHIGGCKPVIDALRKLGWIWDDSTAWLDAQYEQKKIGEDGVTESGTRIVIFE